MFTTIYKGPKNINGEAMLFSSFKNLVSFFRQSNSGLTKSNTSNQFCKPIVGLCALLCMSLWISAAQAQQQMRTNLASADLIPISYTDTDSNEVTAENDPNINDPERTEDSAVGVVDWVEVQIRVVANTVTDAPAEPADAVTSYKKAAWLLSDGSVVDVDSDIALINDDTNDPELTIPTGVDGLTFDAATQNLYVLITHRNHLPIMSASAVTEDSGVYDYDFTTGTAQAVGGGQCFERSRRYT